MKLLEEIKSPWWSLSVEKQDQVVEDLDDIKQSVSTILKTEIGSLPTRPTFGTNVFLYLDEPINVAIPNITREIVNALDIWEKRIEVVDVLPEIEEEKIKFTISWKLRTSEFIINQDIQF